MGKSEKLFEETLVRKPTITVIIPTRNEEDNIAHLIKAINKQIECVICVVDDSDNEKTKVCAFGAADNVAVIDGQHKGLGQAIIDGIGRVSDDVFIVMDADFSHNPKYLPDLLRPILEHGYDMTIGSRYIKGGSTEGWTTKRILISKIAGLMAYPVTWIKDNTSGFFAVRSEVVSNIELKPSSWKIMLEVLIKCNPTAVKEVPICFPDREKGKSKFNKREAKNYITHLVKLAWHRYKPLFKFGVIGLSGALLHFSLLYVFTDILYIWYIFSAVLSIIIASTSNYTLNHKFTFTDRHISNHLIGWIKYQLMSGITDGMYVGLLALLVEVFGLWYMVGAILAAFIIFPIKFLVASSLIWSKKLDISDPAYEWNAFFSGSMIQKWWKRQIAKTVWEWIPNSSRLLDIGCGSSPIIGHYTNAVGVDVNEQKLEFMRNKFAYNTFEIADLSKYSDESFDHIICIEVIEHIDNPVKLIKEIARILKPNGNAVIATPDYSKMLWHIAEAFTPYKEDHYNNFTLDKLDRLCERYGLIPIRYKYVAGCDLIEKFIKE